MLIDCDTCTAPRSACAGCVMTVLLDSAGRRPAGVELDDAEHAALGTLARAGLVPPLRLVRAVAEPPVDAEPETSEGPLGAPARRATRRRGIA